MSQDRSQKPPVVVLTGPTAAGKTAVALDVGERLGTEIVSADSVQVYRYLDIGTAKPTLEERARVVHHLIDVVTPDVPYNATRYAEEAREAAAAIHASGRPVLLVGGTGLYIRAFLEGLSEGGGADPEARERGEPGWLHAKLAARDPETATRLHPNDTRRIVRALEVCERTGRPASDHARDHDAEECPYRVLHLALDPGREALDERIDRRCEAMIEAGLLQEVRRLRDMGYGPELRSMQTIGYRHLHPVVDGRDTLASALESMKRDTRRFARRQRTWIRGVRGVSWFEPAERASIDKAIDGFLGA